MDNLYKTSTHALVDGREIPRISIAICTCNGEKYFKEQLESIVRQTVQADEIIICDDASDDRTLEITLQYSSILPIKIFRNEERLGTVKNFSKAIAACSGEIIFLSDQDDVWHHFKIERTLQAFSSTSHPALVFSDANLIDEVSQPLKKTLWQANRFTISRRKKFEQGHAFVHLLRSNVITGATLAFRAELKELLLPIPEYWIHDYWIASVIASIMPIHSEPTALMAYRVHSGQQIGVQRNVLGKIWKVVTSRQDLAKEEAKYRALKARMEMCGFQYSCMEDAIQLVSQKIEHVASRREVVSRTRGSPVKFFREAVRGNYRRFSYGWIDAFADIFIAD